MMMNEKLLKQLRKEIQHIDEQILYLIAQRMQLSKKIGMVKLNHGITIRNTHVEAEVLKRARNVAQNLHLSEDFVSTLMKMIIEESVSVQRSLKIEKKMTTPKNQKNTIKCLIVGGAGKMGGWLTNFLQSHGHSVDIADPQITPSKSKFKDIPDSLDKYEAIFVSTPLDTVPTVLKEILSKNSSGIVADIASLKTPIANILRSSWEKGHQVTSFHPMFGPNILTLKNKNIIICSVGCTAADEFIASLFEGTGANISTIPIDMHDKFMTYSLGLPHLVNLLFGLILLNSGYTFTQLQPFTGTTFLRQVKIASDLFSENSSLYHAIQSQNPYRDELYQNFQKMTPQLYEIKSQNNLEMFTQLIKLGKKYFKGG